jgi:predicted acylesterase/phospholipase RssA
MVKPKPASKDELVLSGGGTNGVAMLGALHALESRGCLRAIRRFVGTSVGGVVAMLVAVGYRAVEIYRVLQGIDFRTFNELDCDSVLMFYDTLGAVDGEPVMRLLRVMLAKKGIAEGVTFHELLQHTGGRALCLTGYNVLTSKTESFSHANHPSMAVLQAARITISIPLYFRPVEFNGGLYVDGGLVEPTPVRFCRNRATSIVVVLTCPAYVQDPPTPPLPLQMPDFVGLLFRGPGRCLHGRCLKLKAKHPNSVVNVEIHNPDGKSHFMDLDMDTAEKERLFQIGVHAVGPFIESLEGHADTDDAAGDKENLEENDKENSEDDPK